MKEQEIAVTGKQNTRRKLIWGMGLLSLFPLLRFGRFAKKKEVISCVPETPAVTTMKMLTEDGKLVEVDITHLPASAKQKISNKDLQGWIKNKG